MKFKYTNNLSTTLYEGISGRDEVIKVHKLPEGIHWPTIEDSDEVIPLTLVDLHSRVWEIVYAHQVTLGDLYDSLTVSRAHEGTGAGSFSLDTVIENRITASFLNSVDAIPLATEEEAGVIKVGNGLAIDADGVLSANVSELAVATKESLGVVKVGEGMSVTEDGTIDFKRIATKTNLGLVKIGNGFILSEDGTISTNGGDLPVTPLTYQEVTIEAAEDLKAPFELEIPNGILYKVGDNTLEVSVEGTSWYRGKQFSEIGEPTSSSNKINILGDIPRGAQINIRVPDPTVIKGEKGDTGPQGEPADPAEVDALKSRVTDLEGSAVRLTGDQTISGTKIFSETPKVVKTKPRFHLGCSGITKGTPPRGDYFAGYYVFDGEGFDATNELGGLRIKYYTNGIMQTSLVVRDPTPGSIEGEVLSITYPAKGDPYTSAPTPSDPKDNGTKIATTAWVNAAIANIDAIPSGLISLWSGAANKIPAGWALCDGNNNTPDLRGRFVLGASDQYELGTVGGSANVSVSGTVGATTLSVSQLASHSHQTIGSGNSGTSAVAFSASTAGSGYWIPTNYTGSNQSHTHSATLTGSGTNLPPYYVLCYIMKI